MQPKSSRWHVPDDITRQIVQSEFHLVIDWPGDNPDIENFGGMAHPYFPDIPFVANLSSDLLGDGAGVDLLMNDQSRLLPTGEDHHIRIPSRNIAAWSQEPVSSFAPLPYRS